MQTGISTGCLYPMLTEDSVRTLTKLGFQRFEIFFNSFSELEPDYLDRLHRFLDSNGASVISLHPFTSSFESFLLFTAYQRRFSDGLRFYEMYFRAAARLGAKMVVLHGQYSDYSASLDEREYFSRFDQLQQRAACYGVTLLQENVRNFRSKDPDFIRSMISAIPQSAAFVLDTKQALCSGSDPLTMAQAMGPYLKHIHISDNTADNRCVLPGQGSFNFLPLLTHLQNTGYSGDLITEVYRSGFDHTEELLQSQQYISRLIETVCHTGRNAL